ncbi:MAG: GC-type dockerin domain-anchored protein [Phycisphaerales bacterium]
MNRARLIAAATLAAALTAAAPAPAPADTFTVYVFNREFSQNNPAQDPPPGLPDDPTIHVGDTIHWVLSEGFHTVDSCSGMTESFSSGTMTTPGASFDHTFTHSGVFGYYCLFHGFDNGDGTGGGMAGQVTVIGTVTLCTADLGMQGGLPGQDGQLDNNDFIAFINYFFAHDPHADLGVQGGIPGQDGAYDNNDFIAFINYFFQGCH